MRSKGKISGILKTITLVLTVLLIGVLISACQSPLQIEDVTLPSKKPLISEKAHKEDFEYPTKDPSVVEGKKLFTQNCSSCHGFGQSPKQHNFTLKYINSVTPSHLFKAITSSEKHPSFKDKLSINERWDVVMYLRYELFGMPQKYDDMMIKFGSNCAVCHGTRGFGDGDIHYFLNPPPANFNQFDRLYEKTDDKLFEEISDGIPWTAMPPWANRFDKDKNFTFDEKFRWELVKYVRHVGYTTEADLLRDEKLFKGEGKEKIK
jgi:mono/diheme cytochrome c family protein